MRKKGVCIIAVALFTMAVSLTSFSKEYTDSLCLKVYFKQGESFIDPTFRSNEKNLKVFTSEVRKIIGDPLYRIDDITIRSSASPEGVFDNNLKLSRERGANLKAYLREITGLPAGKIMVDAVGEDWETLRSLVEKNNYPDRERILKILDAHKSFVFGRPTSWVGSPKKGRMDLNCGHTWRWLLKNVYPDLRSAGNSIICRYSKVDTVYVTQVKYESGVAPVPVPATSPAPAQHKVDTVVIVHKYLPDMDSLKALGFYHGSMFYHENSSATPYKVKYKRVRKTPTYRFALRTNLLQDAIASPNIGLEFPIKKRFSILAFHSFPWYTWSNDRYAYQILNSGLEFRLWLGDRTKRPVLTGWYTGLYGARTKADLEFESKGYQVPNAYHGGLIAGWSKSLGKRDNWRIDLGLTVGVMPLAYDYYEKSEKTGLLIYKTSGTKTWIGPTNLRCSIVWMIPMNRKTKDNSSSKEDPKNPTRK